MDKISYMHRVLGEGEGVGISCGDAVSAVEGCGYLTGAEGLVIHKNGTVLYYLNVGTERNDGVIPFVVRREGDKVRAATLPPRDSFPKNEIAKLGECGALMTRSAERPDQIRLCRKVVPVVMDTIGLLASGRMRRIPEGVAPCEWVGAIRDIERYEKRRCGFSSDQFRRAADGVREVLTWFIRRVRSEFEGMLAFEVEKVLEKI